MTAVATWTKAGFPANQILLGVASYGHSFSVANTNALQNGALVPYPAFNKANQPPGDSWDGAAGPDVCGVQQLAGGECAYACVISTNLTRDQGIFNFWGLIQGGFLTSAGLPASGIDYRFDNCSQTVSADFCAKASFH
jgi:chitinase